MRGVPRERRPQRFELARDLAAQVGVRADALDGYDWAGRTGRRHRRTILGHLAIVGFGQSTKARTMSWRSSVSCSATYATTAITIAAPQPIAVGAVVNPFADDVAALVGQDDASGEQKASVSRC
jgi:hypothetical protein